MAADTVVGQNVFDRGEDFLAREDRRLTAAAGEFEDDELVEVTPDAIRLRKMLLTENDRKRADRKNAGGL